MKKGFTLMELLAVIVVLAILTLIVTPIVINIVENARKGANLRSMESYAKILESSYVEAKMQDPSLTEEMFLSNISSYVVEYNGSDIKCLDVNIEDKNKISLYGCAIGGDGNYCYVDGKITEDCSSYSYAGKIIYFDVVKGKKCSYDEYKEANSTTGYNGINPNENQTSCLKFYQISSDTEKINLLLDHNTTAEYTWDVGYYGYTPKTALSILKSDTENWNGTLTPENYEGIKTEVIVSTKDMKKDFYYRGAIDYSGYKARFITANEVVQIIGASNFDEATSYEAIDIPEQYSWLYNRTSDCGNYGCEMQDSSTDGYWTASSTIYSGGETCCMSSMCDAAYNIGAGKWSVGKTLKPDRDGCYYSGPRDNGIGIRPVISIPNN